MWGVGQPVVGEVLEPASLPHHSHNPQQLAAEAARQRYGRNPPAPDIDVSSNSSNRDELVAQVITGVSSKHIVETVNGSLSHRLGGCYWHFSMLDNPLRGTKTKILS